MNGIGSIYDLTDEELLDIYSSRITRIPKDVRRDWRFIEIARFMAEWENMQSMFHVKHQKRGAICQRNKYPQNNT